MSRIRPVYERHGFELVGAERTAVLLEQYWTIPDRQVATSVVLAWPPLDDGDPDPAAGVE